MPIVKVDVQEMETENADQDRETARETKDKRQGW